MEEEQLTQILACVICPHRSQGAPRLGKMEFFNFPAFTHCKAIRMIRLLKRQLHRLLSSDYFS